MLLRLDIVPFLILLSLNCVPEPQPDEAAAAADADDVTPRWTVDPEIIDMQALVETPDLVGTVIDCLTPDVIGGDDTTTITYHAGMGGDDDQKPLIITIETRAHEDVDLCVRQVLLKLGGEVLP